MAPVESLQNEFQSAINDNSAHTIGNYQKNENKALNSNDTDLY